MDFPRPLLMIPLRRCGSHAIRLRLNNSPEFYSPYPLHIVDFMPLVPLYGDLQDDDRYFQLIVDICGLQSASMVKWDGVVFEPGELFARLRGRPRSVHAVVWELLWEAGRLHGARVVMDKSLDSVHYADELLRLFPDMLFLNVVRDPRAQVASMNRAIIHDFDSLLNAQSWVRAHKTARDLAERVPGQVLTIRYEDFLSHQEEVLYRVCGFIGIPYSTSMLDVERSSEAAKISKMSDLWEANASAPIPVNIDKFKKSLSLQEIEIIESLTGDFMDYYGYERMTPGRATVDAETLRQAEQRSAANCKQAWEGLQSSKFQDYCLRRFRADYIEMVRQRLEPPARANAA